MLSRAMVAGRRALQSFAVKSFRCRLFRITVIYGACTSTCFISIYPAAIHDRRIALLDQEYAIPQVTTFALDAGVGLVAIGLRNVCGRPTLRPSATTESQDVEELREAGERTPQRQRWHDE